MKLKFLDVVILCGGMGKRLRSVVGESPKPLAQVAGEPFLNLLLKYLRGQGFRRVILCAGYKGKVIEQYYRKHDLGLEIIVSQEKSPLGTGGAVKHARPLIASQPFLVLNGDSFCAVDYAKFVGFHRRKKALVSMAVVRAKNSADFGITVLNQSKRVVGFLEKAEPQKRSRNAAVGINAGIYCFNQEAFSHFPSQDVFSLEYDAFPRLINEDFFGFEVREEFLDIGTPERYQRAPAFFKEKIKS